MLFIDDQPVGAAAPVVGRARGHRDRARACAATPPRAAAASPPRSRPARSIHVPLFVNIGDRVKVQTETGEYMSRA